MNYSELVTAVYTATNRPDLVAETQLAIMQATLALHAADDWWPDRTQVIIPAAQFTTANSVIDLDTYFPRFRKLEVIRPVDLTTNPTGLDALAPPLEILEPAAIFNEFSKQKSEYCYPAGSNLVVRTMRYNNAMFCTYFPYPVAVSPTSYVSWIAAKYPYAIINKAVRQIFVIIGYEDSAARLDRVSLPEDIQYLRQNFISNV